MKTLIQFTIILLTFAFISCGDKGDKFTGRIIENGTNKPLADVMVYIYSETTSSVTLADSVLTDANGRWTSIINGGSLHFIGRVKKKGYFPELGSVFDGKVWRDQEPYIWADGPMANRDYFIDAIGYIRVIIENDPNKSGSELVGNFPGISGGVETLSYFKSPVTLIEANRFHTFSYTIDQKHNEAVKDSIFIKASDTTFLNIKF